MDSLKNDIEKYLQGKLSPREMHALEKKALDDPFLADALEGGSSIAVEDFSADLKDLQRTLDERTRNRSKEIILWWHFPARIAAGIITLAVTGYVIYNLLKNDKADSPLALNKQEEVVTKKTDTEPVGNSQDSIAPVVAPKTKIEQPSKSNYSEPKAGLSVEKAETPENKVSEQVLSTPPIEQEIVNEPVPVIEESKVYYDQPSTVSSAPKALKKESETARYRSQDKKRKEDLSVNEDYASSETKAGSKVHYAKIVKGKVIDAEDGSAMPGVTVTVKGTDERTATKEDGTYQLHVADDPKGELVFSFIGMQSLEVPIVEKDSVNATLSPDYASLNEVVVIGYSAPGDDVPERDKDNIYKSAEPLNGRRAYKNYLLQNVKYPQQALDNKVQGKVTVQFTVQTSGAIDDFKIIKGIGYGCDEEVIRLVKTGPKWTAPSRNDTPMKGKVKVRLKFILPK